MPVCTFFQKEGVGSEIYLYLCTGLHGLVRVLSRSDAFCRTTSKAVYAELSMAESFKDKAVQSGFWVGEVVQIY